MALIFAFFSTYAKAKTVTWVGANSSLWSDPLNWTSTAGSGLPGTNDNVLINNATHQPVMDMDVSVASLTIDGKGKISILKLDGSHSLVITGDMKVVNSGTDKVITSSSVITITNGGNLSGAGEMDLSGNGKLYISGDLRISDLIAGKSTGSKVICNGKSQKIDNGREYHFFDLDIQQGYTCLVHTNLMIDGNLIGGGILFGGNNRIQLAGDMMLATYKPGKSTFELGSMEIGESAVQQLNANTFYILENYNQKTILTGRIKITHQVDFEKGNICLGSHDVHISHNTKITRGELCNVSISQTGSKGYFIINDTGSLKMTDSILSPKSMNQGITCNMGCEIGIADSK